jgi:hypothetical protein
LPATRISPLNDFTQSRSLQPGCGVDLGHDMREVVARDRVTPALGRQRLTAIPVDAISLLTLRI